MTSLFAFRSLSLSLCFVARSFSLCLPLSLSQGIEGSRFKAQGLNGSLLRVWSDLYSLSLSLSLFLSFSLSLLLFLSLSLPLSLSQAGQPAIHPVHPEVLEGGLQQRPINKLTFRCRAVAGAGASGLPSE